MLDHHIWTTRHDARYQKAKAVTAKRKGRKGNEIKEKKRKTKHIIKPMDSLKHTSI